MTCALAAVVPLPSHWLPASAPTSEGVALQVLSLNVEHYDRNYDDVINVIRVHEPNVVGLVEVNAQ